MAGVVDYFELVGVDPGASEEDLRTAFAASYGLWNRRVSHATGMQARHEAERVVAELQKAKAVLLDPERRLAYLTQLRSKDELALPGLPDAASLPGFPEIAAKSELQEVPARIETAVTTIERQQCPTCGDWFAVGATSCDACRAFERAVSGPLGRSSRRALGSGPIFSAKVSAAPPSTWPDGDCPTE